MGCTGREIGRECQWHQVREVTVLIIWVHCLDFLGHRRAEDLENFADLSLGVPSREKRAHFDKFGDHTSGRPHIDLLVVISGAKNKLWGSIVTRADVRD